MGAGNYSLVATVVTGDTITAAERNAEHTNHINNHDFAGLDDYSSNASQMQTTTDPYPASSESLATTGSGELERIRYQIKAILQAIGTTATQWYHDAPTASKFAIGATDIGIAATGKIYLDGVALSGNTYITESSADVMDFYIGGDNTLKMTASLASIVGADFAVDPLKKIYLDGVSNTYIHESTGDTINFVAGGVSALSITATVVSTGNDLLVQPTKKVYIDGGVDTYIVESSGNIMDFFGGGTLKLRLAATQVNVTSGIDLTIPATQKLYLDGGSNSYISESAGDTMSFFVGGAEDFRVSRGGVGEVSMRVYDTDNATLERVSVGIADSGGAGFKVLRIPN